MSNPADRLKTASRQQVCQWVQEAQQYLSDHPDMVIKAFQVTGISLALDGSENHLLRNEKLLQQALSLEEEEREEEEQERKEEGQEESSDANPEDKEMEEADVQEDPFAASDSEIEDF